MSLLAKIASQIFRAPIIKFIASATAEASATPLVISKPTGTIDGHLMVGLMNAQNVAATWTGDTGWSEQLDQAAGACLRVATKVAASEGSSYSFVLSTGGKRVGGHILTYSHAAFDVVGAVSALASPTVAPQITVGAGGGKLLAFFSGIAGASVTFTTPTGMTPVASNSDALAPSWAIFEQDVAAGATGTRTSTPSTGSGYGVLLAIKPGP